MLYLGFMRKYLSLIVCIIVAAVLIQHRLSYSDICKHQRQLKVTTWDALGYYMYLPGIFIYNDVTELKWFPDIDKQYNLSGGEVYQASKHKNGNYVFKYLGGVSILQAPFFFIGHTIAKQYNFPQDGFSPPYQYSIAFGAVLWCIIAFFVLRRILLRYFSDLTVAVTLLLLALATNLIQYVSVDSAMSHAWIFPLYVLVLYTTIKWHDTQKGFWAFLTGLIIGLATISRPTEAVMLFIPLFWNTHTKEAAKQKWQMVKTHKTHIYFTVLGGIIGVLPQLIYWKIATGSFIYDVGSKWDFANPHWRVLFGPEKGWFVYTPITICFIVGFFFMKNMPFRKSVLWFCLLNIYVIIAWNDWRYGSSYSTRALSQSYAVFALPFAMFIEKINSTKWKWLFYAVCIYLVWMNFSQMYQYNQGMLEHPLYKLM
jgi:hypothetical protein